MSNGDVSMMRNRTWIVVALLLAMPSIAPYAKGAIGSAIAAPQSASAAQSQASADAEGNERGSDRERDGQDEEEEKGEREQEKRDREQEARDREQEKKDREQERRDGLTGRYEGGREALDEDRYERAESKFDQLAQINGPQTDAALYWKAYAENRLGKRDTAMANIAELKRRFPQSRWQKDAAALELEVRQSSGQTVHPEAQKDDELRMLAIRGLMNNDPERAMPLLGKVLENGSASPKEKSQALFILAQSGSPQAREILGKIARGQSNPELQSKAIQYLAMFGGVESRKTLAEVYASTSDPAIKRAILRSYMISGDREHLFAAAKNEKDPNRGGVAVRTLGLIHSEESAKALKSIYAKESDRGIKEEVLNSYFLQGNAAAIVAIARGEKDPELKRTAVSKLSIMHSKEAADYLMEILQKN